MGHRLMALVLLVVVGCSSAGGGDDDAASGTLREGYTPIFEDAPCPADLAPETSATCGFLVVPEDRSEPDGDEVRVFVARLPGPAAAAAPVVVLAGGPGDATDLASYLDHPLRDEREVILVDQRGAGRSDPSLACPEIGEDERARLGRAIDDDAVLDDARAAAQACRDRLTAEGVDPAAYDSAAAAADVADLRVALDIDAWHIVGNSYGSRLALTVVRDDPTGVVSLALSGPYPPNARFSEDYAANAERAFQVLFDDCAADPACTTITPDLEATFGDFHERFEAAPVDVTTPDGTVHFDGDVVALLLHGALYESELIPVLPGLITAGAAGQSLDVIAVAALARTDDPAVFSHGLYLSVHCQDEVPFGDVPEMTEAEQSKPYLAVFARVREIERAQCDAWGVGAAPAREDEAVRSDVPALILVGEYDPITPPANGELAAKSLTNATVIELPGLGHDALRQPCPRRVRNEFLADPASEPYHPCLEELAPPPFST